MLTARSISLMGMTEPAVIRVPAREELRQVALELFATDGYAATSLQLIADRAGYAKSNVLYHFRSKEAVLDAAIGPAVDAIDRLVDEFVESGQSDAARGAFIGRFVDVLFEHRLAISVFVNQGLLLRDTPVIDRANEVITRLAAAVIDEQATVAEQMRFGVALAGAAYTLVAGQTFFQERIEDADVDEARAGLIGVVTELLQPGTER